MPIRLAALSRAGNGTRTRDPNLGKVVLYQLSYSRDRPAPNLTCLAPCFLSPLDHCAPLLLSLSPVPQPLSPTVEARGIEPLTS